MMNRFGIDFGAMRALVAISNKQLAQYIWHFLMDYGAHKVQVVHHSKDAVSAMASHEFTHFFVGHHLEQFGGVDFARFIRMNSGPMSEAPILLIVSNPDREKVLECRDAGVNEIMSAPINGLQFGKHLAHMSADTREFVRASAYIGPDRRRAGDQAYKGTDRRR